MSDFGFDLKEVLLRVFKYIFEGLVVAVAAYLIPGKKMQAVEIFTIAAVAAATLSILDLFAPAFAGGARMGTSLAIGSNLAGGFNAPIKI